MLQQGLPTQRTTVGHVDGSEVKGLWQLISPRHPHMGPEPAGILRIYY